jgi:hypothetical protein
MTLAIVIICWVLLGLHSMYLLIKRESQYRDIKRNADFIGKMILCFFLPILTHLVTYITYPSKIKKERKHKVIFEQGKEITPIKIISKII